MNPPSAHTAHLAVMGDYPPPQNITRGNEERAEVALTFDCGPWVHRPYIERILDALEQANTRVTFFVTGAFVETNPDIFARMAARHEIANHSWYHPDFTHLTAEQQTAELIWTEQVINSFGASSTPLWRSPFGAWNDDTLWIASYAGFWLHIMWTTDSWDWMPYVAAETVQRRVVDRAVNGAIVVSHCNSPQTAEVLPGIMAELTQNGFAVTTVTSLLR